MYFSLFVLPDCKSPPAAQTAERMKKFAVRLFSALIGRSHWDVVFASLIGCCCRFGKVGVEAEEEEGERLAALFTGGGGGGGGGGKGEKEEERKVSLLSKSGRRRLESEDITVDAVEQCEDVAEIST